MTYGNILTVFDSGANPNTVKNLLGATAGIIYEAVEQTYYINTGSKKISADLLLH